VVLSGAASTFGLQSERSSEYLFEPVVVELVVVFGPAQLMSSRIATTNGDEERRNLMSVNYDTSVIENIVFNLLVFNVPQHFSIGVLDAYFVVSSS
jgi:hypothetical protein